MKFAFHIIFKCHKKCCCSFYFFQRFQIGESICSSQATQKEGRGHLWPTDCCQSAPDLVFKDTEFHLPFLYFSTSNFLNETFSILLFKKLFPNCQRELSATRSNWFSVNILGFSPHPSMSPQQNILNADHNTKIFHPTLLEICVPQAREISRKQEESRASSNSQAEHGWGGSFAHTGLLPASQCVWPALRMIVVVRMAPDFKAMSMSVKEFQFL